MDDAFEKVVKNVLLTKVNRHQFIDFESDLDEIEITGINKFPNGSLVVHMLIGDDFSKSRRFATFSFEELIGDMIYRKIKSDKNFISFSIKASDMFGRIKKGESAELLLKKSLSRGAYLDADTIDDIGFFKIGVSDFESGFFHREFLLSNYEELPKVLEIENIQLSEWLMKALLQDKYSKELKSVMIKYLGEDWINEKLLIYEVGD